MILKTALKRCSVVIDAPMQAYGEQYEEMISRVIKRN